MISDNQFYTATVIDEQGRNCLQFFGPLDDTAEAVLAALSPQCLFFDLSKISRVSSLGAGIWIRWILEKSIKNVTVLKVPPNFIRVLNSLPQMLPAGWQIESFFVPYLKMFSEDIENVLFIKDKHFNSKEVMLSPLISSTIDDQKLEIDVHPDKYFKFLEHRFPNLKIENTPH